MAMKKTFFLCLLAGLSLSANAQPDIGTLQNPHNAANAARHLPTYLGDRFQRFQVNVFNPYIGLGSNFASMGDVNDYLRADRITSQMVGNTIDKLRSEDNIIAASLDIAIVNVAFNVAGKDGHKALSLGAGINERISVSTAFDQETLLLAYSGNKQFAGQTVELAPRFNGLAYTEYYVAAAYNIRPASSAWVVKPAIRLSYLNGQASVDMQRDNSISIYTEPEGRYLDFGLNYRINTSLGDDSVKLEGSSFNINNKSFQGGSGSGLGMDLGVRVSPRPGILLNAGIMDIGSIRFRKNVTNIYNTSSYRYEGQTLTFNESQSLDLDSLASLARPNYSYNAYSVSLPTKLVLNGSIGLRKIEYGGQSYYRHQLSAMYVQGFANQLSATTAPYVAVGYTHSFGGILNVGANAGIGGLWGGHFGLLASLKAGPFLLGVHTNKILPLVAPNSGRGSDLALLLGLAF